MTSNSIIKLSCIINFIDDKKIFSKGENSFECGYVKSFNYIPDVGILSGQVHASMKNKLYDVKIFFKDKNIEHASCTCPTGLTKCHHMVSLLLHGHNNISVTDISCSWSKKSEDGVLPPCVFIHGLPSTGKTSLVTRLMFLLEESVKSSIVNSICCYTSRLLFEPILKDLLKIKQSDIPNRCDNFMQFLNMLKQAEIQKEQVIIVLDNCEMLAQEQIVLFSKLQELIKSYQLCVIFISQVLPSKFDEDINCIPILFEQYNSDDISAILLRDKPNNWSLSIYQNFLNVFLGSFYGSCRDLVELKHLAKLLFIKYVEPIEDGSCTETNQTLLFRKISPSIHLLLNNVYLGTSLENVNSLSDEKTTFEKLALDLPYYAKYFLIAAYIASFNLPKYDRQLFVKASNKKRKTNRLTNKTENSASQLVGPKAFSLDRLLAIFYAIIEENTNMTANLLAQINTLSDLGLLIRLGDGKLETPKYRCSVSFDCVSNIARTVKFNLNKYLIDKL